MEIVEVEELKPSRRNCFVECFRIPVPDKPDLNTGVSVEIIGKG